jgi:hypothetical protein
MRSQRNAPARHSARKSRSQIVSATLKQAGQWCRCGPSAPSVSNRCSLRLEPWPTCRRKRAEVLRRSIAMLPPKSPSGLSRERALAILGQLVRALRELRRR